MRCCDWISCVCVSDRVGHLGQSLWLREVHGREGTEAGPPPPVDLATERRTGDFVRGQIIIGALTAVHDVSDGGLAVTIAELALAGNLGALLPPAGPGPPRQQFFHEDPGLAVHPVDQPPPP